MQQLARQLQDNAEVYMQVGRLQGRLAVQKLEALL
jgi:hypothetical protein